LKRFSLLSICYTVAGIAGYFALIVASHQTPGSFVDWIVRSLGFLYGTVLYVAGLLAFYVACRTIRTASSAADIAVAIPISLLPTVVGVIGVVHGYISVFYVFSISGMIPEPTDLYSAHATVLVCAMTGLCLTLPSFVILAVVLVVRPSRGYHRRDRGHAASSRVS
jgi:hypothetical protein